MNCPHCHQPVSLTDLQCPHCGEILLALPSGTRLYQQYQIVRPLRRAGGLSYQALDERRQTQVLLLEFFPPGSRRLGLLALLPEDSQPALQRWRERIRIPTQVWGAQSVELAFEQNGTAYAVTALPVGETLMDRLRAGRILSGTQSHDIMLSLAQTLESLHRHGMVDGSFTPERVALVGEQPRLDLGWGKTDWPAAMAPEQLLNPPQPQPASDIYALGATVLSVLTGGVIPSAAERAFGQPLPAIPGGTPVALRRALELALALRADQRPDSTALVRMLRAEKSTNPVVQPNRPAVTRVQTIQAHQGWLTAVATDETQVITTGTDLRLRTFNWQGRQQRSLDLDDALAGLSLTPLGLVAAEQSGRVLVWGGQHVNSSPRAHRIRQLLTRQGNRAVSLNDDGQLGAWDLTGPQLLGTATLSGVIINALQITPGDRIIVGSSQGEVLLFDEVAMCPTRLWFGEDRLPVTALAVGKGQILVSVGRRILAVAEQRATPLATLPGSIHTMCLSPDGQRVAIGGDTGLAMLSLEGQQLTSLTQGSAVRAVHWSAAGLAAGNDRGELLLVTLP